MSNLLDYAQSVGDLTYWEKPFDTFDALFFSQIIYMPFDDFLSPSAQCTLLEAWHYLKKHSYPDKFADPYQKKRYDLLAACAPLQRYHNVLLQNYVNEVDPSIDMQFCACTFQVSSGVQCIAYSGTDLTVAGWKEDANMAYMTVIPAQAESLVYLQARIEENKRPTVLCGHSKGGNLALFSASLLQQPLQESITNVYCFDGPGVSDTIATSEGYAAILPKTISILPQSSIVGLLLSYPPNYNVVKSDSFGVWQHDVFSWQIKNGDFCYKTDVSGHAMFRNITINSWLNNLTPEERQFFVQTLMTLIDATNASVVSDISDDLQGSWRKVMGALDTLPEKDKVKMKQLFNDLLKKGAQESMKGILSLFPSRPSANTPEPEQA